MFGLRLFLFSFFSFCDKVGRSCKVAVRVPFHENISGEFAEKSSVKKGISIYVPLKLLFYLFSMLCT